MALLTRGLTVLIGCGVRGVRLWRWVLCAADQQAPRPGLASRGAACLRKI